MKKVAAAVLLLSGLLGQHPALADPDYGMEGYYLFTGAIYYGHDAQGVGGWYCEYISEMDGEKHWMFFTADQVSTSKT